MSNAKEIKERMGSIQETKKITNAMYLISSSKMKQAKNCQIRNHFSIGCRQRLPES